MRLLGFIAVFLLGVQPLSLAWAGLHDTKSLWTLFQELIVEFRLSYPIFYLGTSKFSPQQTNVMDDVENLFNYYLHITFYVSYTLISCTHYT